MHVTTSFDWQDVGAVTRDMSGRLTFPRVLDAPGIYRFLIATPSGIDVYIGESTSIRRRMQSNYRAAHTGTTNVRNRAMLLEHIGAGRDVHMAVIYEARISIGEQSVTADMTLKRTRLLVEHAALAEAVHIGHQPSNL